MANKSISDFTLTATPDDDDLVLLQRGNEYYSVSHSDLLLRMERVVLTLTQAQVKTLSSVPVTIVSAQGAGTVIEPLSCSAFLDYNGSAYATATNIRLKHSGNSNLLMGSSTSFIGSASDRYEKLMMQSVSATNQQMFANTALVVDSNADSATNGGTITLELIYAVRKFA
jgi:hypothetical protein